MTTLVQLKSQHPEWCFSCGKWHLEAGGIHTCFEHPVIATLVAKVEELEAERDSLKARVEELVKENDRVKEEIGHVVGNHSYRCGRYEELKVLVEVGSGSKGELGEWIERLSDQLAESEAKVKELEAKLAEVSTCATGLLNEVCYLMRESGGVYGLHLNGDNAPWSELEPGGQYERLGAMAELEVALAGPEARKKGAEHGE